jgi:thiamine-phosphate pyrophosphorylase
LNRRINGLYLVTDRKLCGTRAVEDVVAAAVRGGVSCVQLREKGLSTSAFIEEAGRLKKILKPLNVPLIINDRVDVALAVGAEGVHIGQDDMPYETARKLLGKGAIIGLSVETWTDVEKAEMLDVDYLGISPVFETPTKTDTKGAWGIDGLKRIKAFSRHALCAIGGINKGNAGDVAKAGADCIAVVSAICGASDPCFAAQELSAIIRGKEIAL